VGREDVDDVAAHAEGAAGEVVLGCACIAAATRSAISWRWSMRSSFFSAKVIAV
jgi:hypothetical protein